MGYGLDPVGNRTLDISSLSGISSGSFSFNADDELASESYDQNGNVISTDGKTFTCDSQNELMSMGSTVTMLYDGFGNRVSKTVNGVIVKYLVEDDKNPTGLPQVFDELTNGAVTRTYTYGLQRISEEQVISNTWTPSYYGYDGGGSVRNLTNSAGAITDSYEYDAFGNQLVASGGMSNPTPNYYLYRGEQFDPNLGLYYLRARYYNPLSGRFTGVDSLTDQGQPRYEYAAADPVDGADPTGTEDLAEYRPLFPGPLSFISVHFPNFDCGQLGSILGPIAGLIPFCSEPQPQPSPPPPCPECFAQLKYRAVNDPWAQKIHATHAFWYVQDSSGQQWTVSGGPWPQGCKEPNCKLDEWATPYPNSSADATSGAGTWWSIGPSSSICPQVEDLLDAAWGFPNDTITYHWYGPNSNTSAHYVGNAGGFHPPPPPVAIGWWDTLTP